MSAPQNEAEFREAFSDTILPKHLDILVSLVKNKTCSYPRLWNLVLDYDFLYKDSKFGWISEDGEFFGCSYATHDTLLYDVLGMNTYDVELRGWIRVGMDGKVTNLDNRRANRKQVKTLETVLARWEKYYAETANSR